MRSEIEALTRTILLPNTRNATNGPFDAADITAAVQRAYEREWNKARIQLTKAQVVMSTQFTWPSGAITTDMPALLRNRIIHSIYDITDNPQGIGLRTVFYIEDVTKRLRWPSTVGTPGTGPFRDTLLRAFFMPQVEQLSLPESTPQLIPTEYHQLLGWSAAIELSDMLDGGRTAQPAWKPRYEDLQTDYWQACKVPVLADRARILPDDAVDFFYLGAV